MSRLGQRFAIVASALTLVALASPAYADYSTQGACLTAAANRGLNYACEGSRGHWKLTQAGSFNNDSGGGSSFAGIFIVFVILVIAIAVGAAVWRVSMARKMAEQSGLDPKLATRMALFTDEGLDATYLASSLRQPPLQSPATPAAPAASRTATERLAELTALKDSGAITQDEFDARRTAIIDGI
jgi:hypothetical protein